MNRLIFLLPGLLSAEVHQLTLRSAVDLALKQNPDVLLARLDEQRAALAIKVARDPFIPKLYVGSGAAYTTGFPMSVEGSAPSIVQARGVASVYNRQQKFQLERAREESKTASIDAGSRRTEVVYRTVELYLDAERKGRLAEMAARAIPGARKIEDIVRARAEEGRELPVEKSRAALETARLEHRKLEMDLDREQAEAALAVVLGLPAGDLARPAEDQRAAPSVPMTVGEAVEAALRENREIARIESAMRAKGWEAKAERAARLPRLDLVAQYGLFAKFNNFEEYFNRFQRHNGQIGVSLQIPVFAGAASQAMAARADNEGARLRLELDQLRGRIRTETQRRFLELKRAESARQLTRQALEVAREDLGIQLARFDEGRATVKQVEEARASEHLKWMEYYDAQAALDRARYALLSQTGGLEAALPR
ncbi:MAG: TolC family protein [Acidobacteria bacterium]|nr:TolC family protein [Acidobacteriota bacterium]